MSDQAILILFFTSSIGWMTPRCIDKFFFNHEEVQIEIYFDQEQGGTEEIPYNLMYDGEEDSRLA